VTSQITAILSQKMDLFIPNKTQTKTVAQTPQNKKLHPKNKPFFSPITKTRHYKQFLAVGM
jgi:hypothetical protein